MGGGFGGCTVSLVRCGREDEVEEMYRKRYMEEFGMVVGILRVGIEGGVSGF